MRAGRRYESEQPGILSWHHFSAGAHYDPDNVAFGPIVGVDEHLVEPGAGFDWHAHRGVHILSRVLEGTLRHEDSHGVERLVGPGALLVQSTGGGIRHRETNPSGTGALRFVQITVLGDDAPSVSAPALPVVVAGVRISRRADDGTAGSADELVLPTDDGDLLVLSLTTPG